MAITIQVAWQDPYNKDFMWNELMCWAIETFGLNGDRWTYTPTVDYMNFHFPDEKDALMFQLKTAGQRLSNDEVTVEFIGGLLG
jgi:hypothetical protein